MSLGLGEWSTAESLLVAAVAAKTAAFGPDAGELVYTYANLGTLRNDRDRSGAAIEALSAALGVGVRAFGAEHPLVLLVRGNLGMALIKQRRFHDAGAALLAVRAGALARPDPDRVSLAFAEQQLGWLALERRRPAEARDHLRAAEALQTAAGDRLAIADIAELQAQLAESDGDCEAALRHHERARSALTGLVPPEHPRWKELQISRADLEVGCDRHAEALAVATQLLTTLAVDDPKSALLRAEALERQATAHHALGHHADAVRAAAAALELLTAAVAEENPRLAMTLALLATCEAAAGRPQQALEHNQRADQIYTDHSDPDLPARALLRFERARLLADVRPDEASTLAAAALVVLRGAGDGFHRDAAALASWLAQR
ncbi:MAG: hypothetical protein JNK56_37215 [Myxococcales bacterium]|nr:hypothetical protein [Myxococcales bacterium]